MKGTSSMFNVGISLEYHLHSLEAFIYPYSDISFNPFVTFGFKYSFFNNSLTTSLGDWQENINLLPSKYTAEDALSIGAGEAFSFTIGLGTRYKINEKLDFTTQINAQYFFSDKIDGLRVDVLENKNNDWAMSLQLGLVYHLNFSSPLF